MKIAIDIRSTLKKKRRTGIGRYTFELINALARLDSVNYYYLYSRKKFIDFKRILPELPGKNFFHSVDYLKKGPSRVLPKVDIFHTSSYDLEHPENSRFIVTVHDVINKAYPYGHNRHTIKEIDEKLKRILPLSDALVADSYNTKSDLMKFYGVPDSKISVIYPGVNAMFDIGARHMDKEEYILFVGTLEPRKNIGGLIKAFDWLKKKSGIKHKLYIVGMKGWMFENIFKSYRGSEFKKDIVFKGYKAGGALRKLYQGASIFVYPSFYEGFGFPIIEAFSSGVPVVTSKTSSCGEIARDGALLVNPLDYKEIGEAILELISDKGLREGLVKKGLNRAKDFTWDRAAREFLELFRRELS